MDPPTKPRRISRPRAPAMPDSLDDLSAMKNALPVTGIKRTDNSQKPSSMGRPEYSRVRIHDVRQAITEATFENDKPKALSNLLYRHPELTSDSYINAQQNLDLSDAKFIQDRLIRLWDEGFQEYSSFQTEMLKIMIANVTLAGSDEKNELNPNGELPVDFKLPIMECVDDIGRWSGLLQLTKGYPWLFSMRSTSGGVNAQNGRILLSKAIKQMTKQQKIDEELKWKVIRYFKFAYCALILEAKGHTPH